MGKRTETDFRPKAIGSRPGKQPYPLEHSSLQHPRAKGETKDMLRVPARQGHQKGKKVYL